MEKEKTIDAVCKALTGIKQEQEKRNEIYKHGVDLINYENGYLTELLDLITFLLGKDKKEEVDWWLFEDVDKIYYFNDGREDKNVNNVRDFVEYMMEDVIVK